MLILCLRLNIKSQQLCFSTLYQLVRSCISVCFLSTLPTSVPSILLMMPGCKIKREINFSKSFEALMIAIRLKRINSYILIAINFGAADYKNNYLYLVINHLLIFCVLHKLSEKCFRLFSLQCFFYTIMCSGFFMY